MVKIKKTNSTLRNIGVFGIIFSVIILYYFFKIVTLLKDICEKYIDVEGKIETNQIISIEVVIITFIILLFSISVLFFIDFNFKIKAIINKFINLDNFNTVFYKDSFSSKTTHTKYILYFGVLIGIVSHSDFL